ncbi:MAG: HAMP domain-containing histidine kinase, partial [Gammaproteobacteria bacterium]|nr:HAMP domain-containing histidine kinase [Gammaproteobacteria bacterium]
AREAYQVYLLIHGRAGHVHGIWFGLLLLGIMLLILFLSYRGIRWMFQPIENIQQGVQRIGQGDLGHRIAVTRKDELGTLGSNINAMADDIQKMLDAKRQLLLAISHEIRSPITRARVSLELLEDSNPAREIRQDLQEMDTLISELLETERLNTRHSVLNKTPTSMNQLVMDIIGEFFVEQRIETQLLPGDPYFLLDAPRIKLLIKNLLENALRHNSQAGPPPLIELSTTQKLNIRVRDHGAGVETEHLPHLTEPFYRVDKSRQRKTGSYGLGLYLCRVIAEAHGGHLSLNSKPNQGTEVIAVIPVRKK